MKTNTNGNSQIQDKYIRVMAVYDQLAFNGNGNGDIKFMVGKIAVALRDEWAGVGHIIGYAEKMMAAFKPESREWAIMGCVLNILVGGSWRARN